MTIKQDEKALKDLKAKLQDRDWRLNNLYYIQDKTGKKVKFKMNWSQRQFWARMWYMNVILKDRQRGFSTFMAIYILDSCLFQSNTNAGIIDISLPDAKKKLAKIQYAYDNLPDWLKSLKPLKSANKESIEFANDSTVYTGTSHRGGTLQILHISELGKIANKYPEKSREIRTGALNTVAPGQVVVIESTAEGAFGDFYELCKKSQELRDQGVKLTKMDWKFHFFGWWMQGRDEEYIDPDSVIIDEEHEKYFRALEIDQEISLSDEQKAWYVKKAQQQQDDMKREFPATPEEAFATAIEGGIFTKNLNLVRKEGRVGHVPIIPHLPVNTFWDLGGNDMMTIWFHQWARDGHHFVNYFEDHLQGFDYYARVLQDFADDHGIRYGRHYAPHDVKQHSVTTVYKTAQEHAREAGIDFIMVPRVKVKSDAWNSGRKVFYLCWFDERRCAVGWQHLNNYRLAWDDRLGTWRKEAVHDESSHGSDGWLTFAEAIDRNMVQPYMPVGGMQMMKQRQAYFSNPVSRDPFAEV